MPRRFRKSLKKLVTEFTDMGAWEKVKREEMKILEPSFEEYQRSNTLEEAESVAFTEAKR